MPARSPPSPLYILNGAVERTLTTSLLSAISPREVRTRHPALGAHHKQQLERVEILPRHICNHLSAYVSIRQHSSAFVSVHLHTSAYVSVHLHTSAYVSSSWNALEFCVEILPRHICKHLNVVQREDRRRVKSRAPVLPAYVSIRQHTSAFRKTGEASSRAHPPVKRMPSIPR